VFLDTLVNRPFQQIFRYPYVIKYLESRFITKNEIKEYQIGYCNIINAGHGSGSDYKRFMDECWRGRKLEKKIIFPIKDSMGRNVGVIGRSIDTKEFKIFVTEEAKFNGFFYGLSQALPHIYKDKKVYLVEGPFDMHAVRKALPNVVCTLTSGMSENQYNLIKRYCDTIVVMFDSDKAGRRGKNEAAEYPGVMPLDIGYKDPAKGLEVLGESKFKKIIKAKVGIYGV